VQAGVGVVGFWENKHFQVKGMGAKIIEAGGKGNEAGIISCAPLALVIADAAEQRPNVSMSDRSTGQAWHEMNDNTAISKPDESDYDCEVKRSTPVLLRMAIRKKEWMDLTTAI
jgi:hypothetical protein